MQRAYRGIQPHIHDSTYIDETAVVIGDVEIGADSSIWPMCVVRGDVNLIRIGARTNIQDGSVVHVSHKSADYAGHATILGNDVSVGHKVLLHGCTVEDECLIGMGS